MTKMTKNVDLITKYKLSEAVKRIHQINEYTFYNSTMVEDDQDQNQPQDGMQGGSVPMDNGQGGNQTAMNNMGGTNGGMEIPQGNDQMMGGDPNGGMPMDDGQGANQNAMGDMSGGMEQPIDGEMDNSDQTMMGGDDDIEDIEMDEEQPGDEVIDVDELTQSQETTEFKVDDLSGKLDNVMKMISKFSDAIDANDQKIEDLKQEFAKRNPTAEETLNLRSLSSYPYSERPDDYWKKQQEEHPNYKVISDNDVSTSDEQKEFEIRKSDVDNFNERDIMKSLGENHIKLSDFLDF